MPRVSPARRFEQLRVLIADDHRLFAESLRAMLCQDERIEVVGIAKTGDEAVRLATSLLPDMVLMDFSMPGMNGLEATRRIHDLGLPCRILLLTGANGEAEEADEALAIQAGADGFVRKERGADALREVFFEVAALTSVVAGPDRESE
jgi:DNA-binding NarL/FixJ family response regulator